jgi:hypothetical protein
MTNTGRIMPRRITGCCSVHQRRLAKTIKHARHLGTFSSKQSTFTVDSPFAPNEEIPEERGFLDEDTEIVDSENVDPDNQEENSQDEEESTI